jgi:putative peptide zinc metalloprotease protein
MVAKYDRLTNEMQRSCIRLNDELIFSPQKYGEDNYFHIEIPSTSKFFRIGYNEYVFVSLLDGSTSFATALAVTAQTLGANSLNEQQATEVTNWLLENGMASFADSEAVVDAKEIEKQKVSFLQKLNPFWMKLPLGNPGGELDLVLSYSRWMFQPVAIIIATLFILAGMITASNVWDEFSASFNVLANHNWIWMLVGWVVLKILHELAHGIACRRFGGNVKETGIIFILFAPMAYVDVTSSWRFPSRWQRIAVACAGMYVELFLAAACVFMWLGTSSEILRLHLFNVFLMASVSTILFNANPLMRFDGYFVLSDLLKIPNLYANGSKAFQQHMRWLFYGQLPDDSCCEIRNRKFIVGTYGWCAAIWKVLICVGLSITASVMFGGLGIFLAGFGVISWFGKPVLATVKELLQRRYSKPHTLLRAVCVGAGLALFACCSWFAIPNPFATRAPCVVAYEDSSQVRAQSSGFVTEVLVTSGAEVEAGTPLLRLENRELMSQVQELTAKLKKEQTLERMAMDQQEPAEAQIAARNQAAIQQTLTERQSELDDLLVTAPVAGRVVARNLHQMQGKFVSRGDTLLTIGRDIKKEILVSIASEDVDSTDDLIGTAISFEIGTRRSMLGSVKRVTPRASSRVTHASFVAPNGGPLAVTQNGNQESAEEDPYEFCEARFHVVAELSGDNAAKVYAGENGYAKIDSSSETLGKFVVKSFARWIKSQLALAGT